MDILGLNIKGKFPDYRRYVEPPETHVRVRFQENAVFKQVERRSLFNKLKRRYIHVPRSLCPAKPILGWPLVTACMALLMMLSSFSSTAVANGDDIRPQVASLVSSPGRCELKSGQKRCKMALNLIWEAPKTAHYCLMLKNQSEPIKCWQNAWRGSVEVSFNASEKTFFILKQWTRDEVLVQTGISVTGSYKQRKRAQRRKRGFWRMF